MRFVLFFFFCDACCAVSQLIPCARCFPELAKKSGEPFFFSKSGIHSRLFHRNRSRHYRGV